MSEAIGGKGSQLGIVSGALWNARAIDDASADGRTGVRGETRVPESEASDEQLMQACKRGSEEALEQLYARHHRNIYLFIARLIQNRELAEDLAQETFLRVYVNRASWQPNAKFTSWLYRIARNLCIDEKRRYWNRMVQSESSIQPDGEPGGIPYLDRVEDTAADARDAFSRKLDEDTIKKAINQLSDEQREVIILNKYQGLSYGEIANILGASSESIKQRAYRAHLKLRGILEPMLKEYA